MNEPEMSKPFNVLMNEVRRQQDVKRIAKIWYAGGLIWRDLMFFALGAMAMFVWFKM
ncbi:MAG: hypothetical protein KGL39_40980 [Patescibacteria group bacterium]|nr:hypothetical protein [Patescibacteria group bacterium]